MNITDFTARKLASADRAAADQRLTHMDFRLLWLLLSGADRKTGIVRRKQLELARALGVTTRAVQIGRDRLVGCGYLAPIGTTPGGYVSAYNVLGSEKANLHSPSKKGEATFASENKKANGAGQKGEPTFQKGEPSFVHDPLVSLAIPSRAREPSRAEDALGPLGAELRRRIEPVLFDTWFGRGEARLVSQSGDTVTLAVRSEFFAAQIMNRFESHILASAPGVTRLVMEVH
ncbi:DnaA N-terminal domain-containing protein [Bradyrhizobium sp. USDA 3458]|uniref:DnaA N-terminal domain-containing protein n=1 Tax=Bradyrhizobium sp. USDA 3458 TaxID=2591461 RepID=UPI001144A521|nr:DnaA N-terminal domain-containing protein [Bradyrhizobium sp. USDA 3458]